MTDNERLLAALEASEQKRQLAENERDRFWNLSDELIAKIDAHGTILSVNPAGQRLVDSASLVERIHIQDRATFLNNVKDACTSRQTRRVVARVAVNDGSIRHFQWSIACDDAESELFIVGHDISELMERQHRQRAAEGRLAQVQKMEMLGELASGVAHDFNNLLFPIVTVLDLLRRRPTGDEQFDELAQGAAQAAENARAMVKRILNFSKNQHVPAKPHALAPLLRDTQRLALQMLPDTLALDVTIPEALPEIWLPPEQLEVTLINLIINARDAMPNGGIITLAARHDGALDKVLIEVCDQGCGMDAETLARATQRFFTTKSRDSGTGLGLYMAERFAEQCGGSLSIDSAPDAGTRITLHLPVGNMKARRARQKSSTEQ